MKRTGPKQRDKERKAKIRASMKWARIEFAATLRKLAGLGEEGR